MQTPIIKINRLYEYNTEQCGIVLTLGDCSNILRITGYPQSPKAKVEAVPTNRSNISTSDTTTYGWTKFHSQNHWFSD
jgi:hypothetical protein